MPRRTTWTGRKKNFTGTILSRLNSRRNKVFQYQFHVIVVWPKTHSVNSPQSQVNTFIPTGLLFLTSFLPFHFYDLLKLWIRHKIALSASISRHKTQTVPDKRKVIFKVEFAEKSEACGEIINGFEWLTITWLVCFNRCNSQAFPFESCATIPCQRSFYHPHMSHYWVFLCALCVPPKALAPHPLQTFKRQSFVFCETFWNFSSIV